MPDLQDFVVDMRPDESATVLRFRVQARVVQSRPNGNVLHDLTGADAITFGLTIPGFSRAQHREVAEVIIHKLLRMRAALED